MSALLRLNDPLPLTADGGWLQPLTAWPQQLAAALRREPVLVRALIAGRRGSAPREAGACMLVGRDGIIGSVGGGHLEWQATMAARALLDDEATPARLQKMILGTELGQCCGGVVELWLERWTQADRPLLARMAAASSAHLFTALSGTELRRELRIGERAGIELLRDAACVQIAEPLAALPTLLLFGAGHVGQALVRTLAGLPLQLIWSDPRPGFLPADLPEQVSGHSSDPLALVASAAPRAHYLVMTHDHALDYQLCLAILRRDDSAWLGLIGSHSKGARFRSRLAREGLAGAAIDRMICPVGVGGISSKWPAAIAVSIAAQLLQTLSAAAPASHQPAAISCAGSDSISSLQSGCAACPTP